MSIDWPYTGTTFRPNYDDPRIPHHRQTQINQERAEARQWWADQPARLEARHKALQARHRKDAE